MSKPKPIDEMTSAEAEAALAELDASEPARGEWWEKHKPPSRAPAPVGPGLQRDALHGAGEEYRRIMLQGTPEEAAELHREIDAHRAESGQRAFRRDALKSRVRVAREKERREAAPEDLAAELEAWQDRVERVQAARAELADAEAELAASRRRIPELREMIGPEASGLPPEELRAYWLVTAADSNGRLKVRRRNDVTGTVGPASRFLKDVRDLLEPPPEGLLPRLKRRVITTLNLDDAGKPDLGDDEVRREVDRVRARLIGEGDLERLRDAHEIGVEALRERHRGPGRQPPSRDQASRWLAPKGDPAA